MPYVSTDGNVHAAEFSEVRDLEAKQPHLPDAASMAAGWVLSMSYGISCMQVGLVRRWFEQATYILLTSRSTIIIRSIPAIKYGSKCLWELSGASAETVT